MAIGLIGPGGIRKAVGNHDLARGQSGFNQSFDVLHPRRVEQQAFGERGPVAAIAAHQQIADFFGFRRTTRFARGQHIVPRRPQGIGKAFDLGAFPGALAAFQRNEDALGHQLPGTDHHLSLGHCCGDQAQLGHVGAGQQFFLDHADTRNINF